MTAMFENNMYSKMASENPGKYPARMGKTWNSDEVLDLLRGVKSRKSVQEIAQEHERTVGSIRAKLKGLAADFYINYNKPIEEIEILTGLSKNTIQEAIDDKEAMLSQKYAAKKVVKTEPTMSDLVAMISDIQMTVRKIHEKLNKST
jgi:hypothetical protein